jgi:hypothetical protein
VSFSVEEETWQKNNDVKEQETEALLQLDIEVTFTSATSS